MKSSLGTLIVVATVAGLAQTPSPLLQSPPASATEAMYRAAANSAEQKFDHIQKNAQRAHPDQRPTVLTEREINAYLSSGRVTLPKGVRAVQFSGTPGVVRADARVDFDAITAGSRNLNPLMALFSGVHEVQADAHAVGAGGHGRVHIDAVSIDGVGVPRIALEYFVDHYLKPKHPEIGLDSTFQLPERIDIATVGQHTLTVTQK